MFAWPARLWDFLTSTEFLRGALVGCLAAAAIALALLVYSRWGRSRTIEKCLALSGVVHLILAGLLMTVDIVPGPTSEEPIEIPLLLIGDGPPGSGGGSPTGTAAGVLPVSLPEKPIAPAASTAPSPGLMVVAPPPAPTATTVKAGPRPKADTTYAPAATTEIHPAAGTAASAASLDSPAQRPANYQPPAIYSRRFSSGRGGRTDQNPRRDAAILAALRWLAENQEPDGRWDPVRNEGGRENHELGRDRQSAGRNADTGVTGLALLALAAAGNTHLEGDHRKAVQRGVEFLLRAQAADGSLGGNGSMYEFMYCHGIATFALCEVLGMSGDERLRPAATRAVAYTVAAQDPVGGGWRYRPRDPGDTSQLGWQLMALKSGELAGIPIPLETWRGAARFLESVSSGSSGGLASYRPGETSSRTMTAEALACRQFLGLPKLHPSSREAADYLLGSLPGEGTANLYYWYYGTMACYQLQGSHWKIWNEALQQQLLTTQRQSGPAAGSWDPQTAWDGYGGRVYSTALAALALEAYYRFLPL